MKKERAAVMAIKILTCNSDKYQNDAQKQRSYIFISVCVCARAYFSVLRDKIVCVCVCFCVGGVNVMFVCFVFCALLQSVY